MLARITTRLSCKEGELWQTIIKPESLQYLAWPILRFAPAESGALDDEWQVEKVYPLKLYFLKFIPMGRHQIQLVKIDKKTSTISSRESGRMARVWDHNIGFYEVAPGEVRYTDGIDIQAGWLTPAVWLFAQLFYRHRHRRLKALLRKGV
jgi:hypothetical protein